jgi:hypothetical protein
MKEYTSTPFTVLQFRDPKVADKLAISYDAGVVAVIDGDRVILSFEGNLFEDPSLKALEARIETAGRRLLTGEETVARSTHPKSILNSFRPIGTWDEINGFNASVDLKDWNPGLCTLIQRVKMVHPDAEIQPAIMVAEARGDKRLRKARHVVLDGSITHGTILGSGNTREDAWRDAKGTGVLACPTGANAMRLRLVVDIEFERNSTPREEIIAMMAEIPKYAANRGMMTGDSDAEVVAWDSRIDVVCA